MTFIGIDIGTQGVRVVLVDAGGQLLGSAEQAFPLSNQSREEQSPLQWWDDCLICLQRLLQHNTTPVTAISVTSTSGTIIPLDAANQPLHNAIMYSDPRSAKEADHCKKLASEAGGYNAFSASCGLPKMLWYLNRYPEKPVARFVHAADFIIGKLSGHYDVSDYTNALKSGYDVHNYEWPDYLPIQKSLLPRVVASGTVIAPIEAALANTLGLARSVQIVAGMTDGCAAQIASGAARVGDWNTTIGTTLVVKGVTTHEVDDPFGRLYCHRHPEGYWMPGGASNTGADWIAQDFGHDLQALSKAATSLIPGKHLSWPLKQAGERFPFIAPQARGFQPAKLSREELFTANLEGVAYIERYAYDVIEQLSNEKVSAVYTAGGGSNSDVWLTIRSNVLGLPVYKMKHVTGAVGAAILAASNTHFSSLREATKAMTQTEKEVEPVPSLTAAYRENYCLFIETLVQKGYIEDATHILDPARRNSLERRQ